MAARWTNDFEVWYSDTLGPTTADNLVATGGDFEQWYTSHLGPVELVSTGIAPLPPQVAAPVADVADGGWTNELGTQTNLYASVSEAVAVDTDYLQSSRSPALLDEVKLRMAPTVDPGDALGDHAVSVRYGKSEPAGDDLSLTVTLYRADGTTAIASAVYLDIEALTTATLTLTEAEAATIPLADYATGLVVGLAAVVGSPIVDYAARWGVVEYWPLNEASGNALATLSGANTMTDTSTVTSAAGKVTALARQFTLSNFEYFTLADNATVSTGNLDFWAAAWVLFDSIPSWGSYPGIVGKWGNSPNWEWLLYFDGDESGTAHKFSAVVSGDGSSFGQVYASTFGSVVSTATWYFVMMYHDAASNLIGISVNGGAFDTASHTTGSGDRGSPFGIGYNGSANAWNGRINAVAYGKSPPLGIAAVAVEIRDRLYNSGAGRPYPWTT